MSCPFLTPHGNADFLAKIRSEGKITVPKEVRDKYNLKKGDLRKFSLHTGSSVGPKSSIVVEHPVNEEEKKNIELEHQEHWGRLNEEMRNNLGLISSTLPPTGEQRKMWEKIILEREQDMGRKVIKMILQDKRIYNFLRSLPRNSQ